MKSSHTTHFLVAVCFVIWMCYNLPEQTVLCSPRSASLPHIPMKARLGKPPAGPRKPAMHGLCLSFPERPTVKPSCTATEVTTELEATTKVMEVQPGAGRGGAGTRSANGQIAGSTKASLTGRAGVDAASPSGPLGKAHVRMDLAPFE